MSKQLLYSFLFFCLTANLFSKLTPPEKLVPYKKGNKWGYSTFSGKLVIDAKYDSTTFFFYDKALVFLDGKVGLINPKGELIIKPEYESLQLFNDLFFIVSNNGKYGIIDIDGEITIETSYDKITPINSKHLILKKDNKFGVSIMQAGVVNEIIPSKYDNIYARIITYYINDIYNQK